jgi:hypothetical protein
MLVFRSAPLWSPLAPPASGYALPTALAARPAPPPGRPGTRRQCGAARSGQAPQAGVGEGCQGQHGAKDLGKGLGYNFPDYQRH